MQEKFSTPESYSKKEAEKEIEEGLAEHLDVPKSKEGKHRESAAEFGMAETKEPLKRQDLEKEAADFVGNNLEKLVPLFLQERQGYGRNWGAVIKELGITNEALGDLGVNYFIREENGELNIFQTDENNPDGYPAYNLELADLLALAYAAENIRTDSKKERGGLKNRYFLKTQKRYLYANDFGMKTFSEDEQGMVTGDVEDLSNFIGSLKNQFTRIKENTQKVAELDLTVERRKIDHPNFQELQDNLGRALTQEEQQHFMNEHRQQVGLADKEFQEQKVKNILERCQEHPRYQEVLLEAEPLGKIERQLHFNFDKLAEKYGFTSDDPVKDYQQFEKKLSKLKYLFKEPSREERESVPLNFMYYDPYHKPVILREGFDKDNFTEQVKNGIHDVLVIRAVEKESDEVKNCFNKFSSKRGPGSPYAYGNAQVYDLIKEVGVEKTEQILSKDDRDVSRQVVGLEYLRSMGYDFKSLNPDDLKKQLHEANKLSEAGVWDYFKKRNQKEVDRESTGGVKENWTEVAGKRGMKNLFFEGKRMYWLAQEVWRRSQERTPEERFYQAHNNVDWSNYDLSEYDVTKEKLDEYLAKQKNLIASMMGLEGVPLGLIIEALDSGKDLKGIALAYDKKRYMKGLIEGREGSDLESATADWLPELKSAVSKEELELYYEYANDYINYDPNGLIKYATWKSTPEGQQWDELFSGKVEKKSDLDFRICISQQTEEVSKWYKEGAEYVGNPAMQNYLLRFNATRNEQRGVADLHDVLFWVPNIKKLESKDARSILLSIETMDESQEFRDFLPRYDNDKDPLKDQGSVSSLRELKKRVFGIESNIDLSSLPPEIMDIVSAPGFNLSALESMRQGSDFKDLVEGKLDKDQPFTAHKRLFAGRQLTEALKEGLGSQKNKIKGTAVDFKGLFYDLNQLVKDREIGGRKMKATDLLESVPVDLEEEVIELLQKQRVDIGPLVEAQIHNKSDPHGWVCGNYTDCCMPFGDSKNDDYMLNPSTQYFTIQYNGRIVAQSVVVDSKDGRDESDVVVLDNIEIANNYKNLSPLIANVYRTFWTEYTSKPVKVGTGYSDLIPPGGKLEDNNYSAKTRLQYSDATGSKIYDLPKIRGIESMDKVVTFANLSERDAELISKMEAESYPEGVAQGKDHIKEIIERQRDLDVAGADASFIVREGQEVAGYVLVLLEDKDAGDESEEEGDNEEDEEEDGEVEYEEVEVDEVVRLYDMVVLPKFRGTSVIKRMMERVVDIASANDAPIETEAKSDDSYALLMSKRVRDWFESKGYYLAENKKLKKGSHFLRFDKK